MRELVPEDLRARRRANLERLLRPERIAFVGGRHLEHCIALCRRAGFPGEIHVVNPERARIADIPCAPSISALPDAPDAAFIALSPLRTVEAVAALSKVGAGGAVCHAAGFGELGGEHVQMQRELAVSAGELAVVGPNCMGVLNAFDRVALWGADGHFQPVDGNGVALISQSGAFLYGIVNTERAYPMGYGLSLGNQAVIDMADAIEIALDDERVRVIGLYCDGLCDGVALGNALARALECRIPVVLLAGGGVPAAAERSISHTGNLAVPRDFWHALAERYGLIEVTTLKQLVETTKFLAISGVPDGSRIFVAAMSGGACSLVAEQAPARGLALPPVGSTNHDRIRHTLPDFITISNPFDLNLPWRSEHGVSLEDADSICTCLKDASQGNVDTMILFIDIPWGSAGYEKPWLPTLDAMVAFHRLTGLPTVVSGLLPDGIEPMLRERLQREGVCVLMGMGETIAAVSDAAGYRDMLEGFKAGLPGPLLGPGSDGPVRSLDEYESKERLAAFGLKMPPRWAGGAQEAPAAAARLGFPVAVKVLDASIAHKSKIGGVRLGLASETEVQDAVSHIRRDIEAGLPGKQAKKFLVETMATAPVQELILGVKRHAELGLALLIGRGGVDAELHRDYRLILLPADARAFERALDRLRIPGLAASARRAVLDAMHAVAQFAVAHAGELVELDVNPLLILEDSSALAVDALMVLHDEGCTQ